MLSRISIPLLLLIAGCELGTGRSDLEQCAGNHPDDSVAVWFQDVGALAGTEGITGIATHPSRNCITIGVSELSYIATMEARLQDLGIPRDAVVIAESGE